VRLGSLVKEFVPIPDPKQSPARASAARPVLQAADALGQQSQGRGVVGRAVRDKPKVLGRCRTGEKPSLQEFFLGIKFFPEAVRIRSAGDRFFRAFLSLPPI
jgi:hypothetical protein